MDFLHQLQQHLPPLAFDAFKFGNGLILLALLFVPLEKRFALRPRTGPRQELGTDLAYYFLTSLLPARLLVLPLAGLVWLLQSIAPSGLLPGVAALPTGWRLAAAFVVAETGFYWGHRWMHQSAWLWRYHAVHHSAQQMDWLVNSRAHPVDLLFVRLCGLTPLYVLGLARPAGAAIDWVPLLIVLVGSTWGYLIHANLGWRVRWLERVVATPAFHHWHHAHAGADHRHGNYAALLPGLDCLFGSYRVDPRRWPAAYGIDEAMDEGVLAQLLRPFMRRPPDAR